MMTTVPFTAFLAVLVLQYYVFTSTFGAPVISPILGPDVCEGTVCGRGSCVAVSNNTLGFECECEPGWQRAALQGFDYPGFMPCVFPNCTLNHTCSSGAPFLLPFVAPPPPPPGNNENEPNPSFFDPCTFADCGGGRCNRTSPLTHSCVCEEGFNNLLNATVFPCYRQCAFGEECQTLGFNSTTSILDPNPFSPNDNHATSLIKRAEIALLITMMTTLARAIWKYI